MITQQKVFSTGDHDHLIKMTPRAIIGLSNKTRLNMPYLITLIMIIYVCGGEGLIARRWWTERIVISSGLFILIEAFMRCSSK